MVATSLFFERSIYNEVLSELRENAERIRGGEGFTPRVHIRPIVFQNQLEWIFNYIESGKESGEQIVTRGERIGGDL